MTKIELEHSIVQEIRQCSTDTLVEVLDFIQFLHVKRDAPWRHPGVTEVKHAPVTATPATLTAQLPRHRCGEVRSSLRREEIYDDAR